MRTNKINSNSSEQKYVYLSNGLIQNLEICYTFTVWIHTAQVTIDIFVRMSHLSIIQWWFSIMFCPFSCILKSASYFQNLDPQRCAAWQENKDYKTQCHCLMYTFIGLHKVYHPQQYSFTWWSLSGKNEVLYGRIVVCLSKEQLGYLTKPIIYWTWDIKIS